MKKLFIALTIALAAPSLLALDLPKPPAPPVPHGLPKPPAIVPPGDLIKQPVEPKEVKSNKKKRHHHKEGQKHGHKKRHKKHD